MDRLTALRVFCAIVREGSFSSAAKTLRLSNAAASKNVSELEARIGAQLIVRSTRRLKLTEAGEAFYGRVSSILADLDEAEDMIADRSLEPVGPLRVSLPMSLGIVQIVPLLRHFTELYPGIVLDLDLDDAAQDIIKGGYDLAIRGGGELPNSSFRARKLATFDRVLCASPRYLESRGPLDQPEDVISHSCIVYTHAFEPDIWRFAGREREASVSVRPAMRLNNSLAIAQVAKDGFGLAILPLPYVRASLEAGQLVSVLPEWKIASQSLYAIFSGTPFLPRRIRVFVDFLVGNLSLAHA